MIMKEDVCVLKISRQNQKTLEGYKQIYLENVSDVKKKYLLNITPLKINQLFKNCPYKWP